MGMALALGDVSVWHMVRLAAGEFSVEDGPADASCRDCVYPPPPPPPDCAVLDEVQGWARMEGAGRAGVPHHMH
jgi:hypothetical protein